MGKALYIHSVQDAVAIAGGPERLAEALGVSAGEVERWSEGRAIPECGVLLRVIDIVLHPEQHFPPRAAEAPGSPPVQSAAGELGGAAPT